MSTMTHDGTGRFAAGLGFAAVSALSFGLSGALAGGLLDAGWSAGAAVLVRMALAALVVVPFGVLALRGRWHLLRRSVTTVLLYGLLAVAGAQFCYFSAIAYMPVAPALLIEYIAPVAVLGWLWLTQGQRPGPVTLLGALLAIAGLALVIDVFSGATLHPLGVLWALGAMVGAAAYFVISADDRIGLPPLALAGGGLLVGTVVLGALGLLGLLPMTAATTPVTYAGGTVAWWVPVAGLGLVTAGLAYTTGIAAGRRLGSRVASFVALSEVVAAVVFAWLLLAELPGPVQLGGGALILAGIVVVRLGERTVRRLEPGVPVVTPS